MQPNDLMGFALDMIQHDPALQNDPNAREMIDAIESGDVNRGRQIARNLCDRTGEIVFPYIADSAEKRAT